MIDTHAGAGSHSLEGRSAEKKGAFDVAFDGATGTVAITGEAPNQATRERVLPCCADRKGGRHAHAT